MYDLIELYFQYIKLAKVLPITQTLPQPSLPELMFKRIALSIMHNQSKVNRLKLYKQKLPSYPY